MCTHRSCIRRSTEFHIVVILFIIVIYVWLSSNSAGDDENVNYDYEENDDDDMVPMDHQRNKKCIKSFIIWMYLLLLLFLSFFTRISDRSYIGMLWSTMSYSVFLPTGLVILWPILEENAFDNFGHVAMSRPTAWVTCAFLGLAHLMNLIFYTKKLKMEQDDLQVEMTTSILSNKTDV